MLLLLITAETISVIVILLYCSCHVCFNNYYQKPMSKIDKRLSPLSIADNLLQTITDVLLTTRLQARGFSKGQ